MTADKEELLRLLDELRGPRPKYVGIQDILKFPFKALAWLTKCALVVLFIVFFAVFYNLIWAPDSQKLNKELRGSLERKEDIDLQAFFQKNETNAYLLLLPAYTNASAVQCPGYPPAFADFLKIKSPVQDGLTRLALFNSTGVIHTVTLATRDLFCDKYPPPTCARLDRLQLRVDSSSTEPCYRLAAK